jgi:hypothetical protein
LFHTDPATPVGTDICNGAPGSFKEVQSRSNSIT